MIGCVHGYGIGLDLWPFVSARSELTCGFEILKEDIVSGDCAVYNWRAPPKSGWNPLASLQLYYAEASLIRQRKLQLDLYDWLQSNSVTILVAHSMGCQLVLNMIESIGLPPSIRKVVFVAADIASTLKFPEALETVKLVNIFCPWDQALLWSWLLNTRIPAGLLGWNQAGVDNKKVVYTKGWNYHAGVLEQRELRDLVINLSE